MSDGSIKSIQYAPGTPFNPDDVLRYVNDEFTKISDAIRLLADGHLDPVHVEPLRKREGDVRFADGTDWDPGCGRGPYIYLSDEWRPLVTQRVIIEDENGDAWNLEQNGAMPVNIQDQTSPAIISPVFHQTLSTTLSVAGTVGEQTITLTSVVDFVDDTHLVISNPTTGAFHICDQVGAPVGNVIEIDTPLAFDFASGSFITAGAHNLSVLGTRAAPVIFKARVPPAVGSPVTFDVTRLIFLCETATKVDLSKFGDIVGGLPYGIVIRRNNGDGTYQSILNAKTNGDLASFMYDFTVHEQSNPAQGVDGFNSRLTFAGQNKIGVTIRLAPGQDLEVVVQDDLSSLTELTIIAEGHVVTD